MLAAVLHLSTALPKPSAAALKPAAQMDATLVTKLNSGGWLGPTAAELKAEAPFELGCGGWCDNHTTSWEYKCFWSAGVCSTCDECTGRVAPAGPRCEHWCESHTKDWTTKCSWKSEQCSTCDGCIAPAFPPPPYTPPVPSTQPPPLAPSPSPPSPWEYSSATCESRHHAGTFFKNPHLDDCPVGNSGLLMCSQATTVGTLCYYSVGNTCGAAIVFFGLMQDPGEAPLQPYSCCVAGNKDATCNGGNVILQVAIPPSPPPPPPYTPPPASFWGAKDNTDIIQNLGNWGNYRPGIDMKPKGWNPAGGAANCASNDPTYSNVKVYYKNMGSVPWVQCMQLAAENKMQVNGEAGTGNLYPAWSPIATTDGASAYASADAAQDPAYGGGGHAGASWTSPSQYKLADNANCILVAYKGGAMEEGPYFRDGTPYTVQTAQVTRPLASSPTGSQCLHFKYAHLGPKTSYMCQWHAASNGASVLSSSTLGLGNIVTAMPTFYSCNTNWWWDGTNPQYTSAISGDEGTPHACYIGYLDHMC